MSNTMNRILLLATFLAFGIIAVGAVAQSTTRPSNPGTSSQAAPHKSVQNAAEGNPGCQRILQECKNLGFIVGEWKQDNGVWKDCFDPVVHGGTPTRDGKSVNVPVSQSDLQSCRAAVGHQRSGAQPMTPNAQKTKPLQ